MPGWKQQVVGKLNLHFWGWKFGKSAFGIPECSLKALPYMWRDIYRILTSSFFSFFIMKKERGKCSQLSIWNNNGGGESRRGPKVTMRHWNSNEWFKSVDKYNVRFNNFILVETKIYWHQVNGAGTKLLVSFFRFSFLEPIESKDDYNISKRRGEFEKLLSWQHAQFFSESFF